jgi:LAO/AO transport system kinase
VRALVPEVESQVRAGELTATLAADRLLSAFHGRGTGPGNHRPGELVGH